MKKSASKIWLRTLYIGGVCFCLSILLYFSGAFTFLENKTYDSRCLRSAKYYSPNEDIILIAVDQQSLDWALENYGWSWPWPREAYARLIDFVSAGNAKSFAFDMIYSEPSLYGPEDDAEFARAERDSGFVIQTVHLNDNGNSESLVFPIPVIKDNAAMLGNITSIMDDDDVIRRSRLSFEYEGKLYPSLGTAPLVLKGEARNKNLPVLKDGSVLLRYHSSIDNFVKYPAFEILENYDLWKAGLECDLPPENFEDAYIYFALYATGLFDICSTPVSQVSPGVGVHMTTLDNYLENRFIRKTPEPVSVLWFLLACMIGAFSITISGHFKSQKRIVSSIIIHFSVWTLIAVFLPYLLFVYGIWLPMVGPMAGFYVSFLVALVFSFMVEGKQKRFIKAAFSQCLSKDVVNQIMNNPDSFKLGGDKYQMSAIFTDIQKFSSFSELLTAGELGELLNYYLTRMSEIIIEENGTVDKYEGDAIVAMVGAPIPMEDHGVRACRAAIKMKKAEELLNAQIKEIAGAEKPAVVSEELYSAFKIMVKNNKTIFTRIGINSGEMIAGYFGSENKKNYTMMGNNVNLASRLEGVNKHYSTGGILISESTRNLLGENFIVRSLDRVRVVNVNTPIRLYELLEEKQNADASLKARVERWENAMKLFESADYEKALKEFKTLAEENNQDKVAAYYTKLISEYFIKNTYPTEKDDFGAAYNPEDGVFKLLQK